jgi:hypothetical protein
MTIRPNPAPGRVIGIRVRWHNRNVATEFASEELSRKLRRRGALILAVAGLVWLSAGPSVSGAARAATAAGAIAVTLAAIAAGLRSGSLPPPTRRLPVGWSRQVGLVNLGQVAAIAVAVVVLIVVHGTTFIPAVICLIFGLHFLPLARLFGQWQYRWTGALLCAAAIAGIAVYLGGSSGSMSRSVVGLGAAVILWVTSLHVAIRG